GLVSGRIMYLGLGRERHHVDMVVATSLAVPRNAINIAREDDIELLGRSDVEVKIRRIFFVPEHRADSVRPTVRDKVAQWVTYQSVVVDDQVAPKSSVAGPSRLNQEKRWCGRFDLATPMFGR
ncbi:MAG: hypothetical protein OXH68_16715, partial [Gammaproteobacteria bacterium]|nr:hypothetical protein [Gammaproteobacteria bacterium]